MQVQQNNTSEDEELSKYKKRGYEYMEEGKIVLDELVTLYRKRLEFTQIYVKNLSESYSIAKASIDPCNSLYELLVRPIMDCLQRDIEGYMQYAQSMEINLSMTTTPMGSCPLGQEVRRNMEAVQLLYSEYSESCDAVSNLPPPFVSYDENWRTHEEGTPLPLYHVKHRQIAARLHPKQKTAKAHFETDYPKLLDDHMAYMEQVKKLAQNDSTHRSELSTTIARNATEENNLVYHFSTTDAIAVPYMKMDLEKNRREYRHAPILNILTRKLEEARTVIFGRDIDLESDDDIMQEVLVACLHRYPKVQGSPVVGHRTRDEGEGYPSNSPRIMPWIDCWEIIHRVEVDPSIQNIHDTVSKIQSGSEMRDLISMIMRHTRMAYPLLNIVDERSMEVLGGRPWDRTALVNVMKDVNSNIRRIMKACAVVCIQSGDYSVAKLILQINHGRLVDRWECQPIEVVLDMWDFDLWRPLPEDVEWDIKWQSGGWCLCRERFIRGKQYKYGGVHLEVDENGNMLDTLENQQRIEGESIQEQPKSRFLKMLRKLKI